MVYRLILAKWAKDNGLRFVLEGEFTNEQVEAYNKQGYNCYFLPNSPSQYDPSRTIAGTDIDRFDFVFVDMDLKEGKHDSKEAFIETLLAEPILPNAIVDSGNGVHAYWQVEGLDAMSYLRLQRRLCRKFQTDEAIGQIYQLMRVPGTVNVKVEDDFKLCEAVHTEDTSTTTYDMESMDKWLPPITNEDETYCKEHFERTYHPAEKLKVDDQLPKEFKALIKDNDEARRLFFGPVKDRSAADFRLGHLLHAQGFTKEKAMSVLVNTSKAAERTATHRYNYAENIVNKIWSFELTGDDDLHLGVSVKDILNRGTAVEGTRFDCHPNIDGTEHGFRLTEVLGLIGGAGAGKTSLTLNCFKWFVERNPDFYHLFVPLEQPKEELALRWQKIVAEQHALHDKVIVLSNYNEDGSYRNLSLQDIQEWVLNWEKKTGKKMGCVVIDHIGVLKKKTKDGENQGLIDICHQMKAFAKATNTFLIMQSQTNRQKAGIGDVELDKDAAYGTSAFEWYCDYVMTTWQPLKRVYDEAPHMTVTAYKFCKIRHKNAKLDKTKEDKPYAMLYDVESERLRELTDDEWKAYEFYSKKATTLRNKDHKREPAPITRMTTAMSEKGSDSATKPKSAKDNGRAKTTRSVH